jgi:hypothetical protein
MTVYGVIIDMHLPRQDRGIPTFFDGWYANREDAEEMAEYFKAKSPNALVHLVQQVE